MQFGAHQESDQEDFIDDEERQRVLQVEIDKQERAQNLYLKQEDELKLKQQRKTTGREEMTKWLAERSKQNELRKQLNKQTEVEAAQEKLRLKTTTNQWERVISNVEINQSQYVGGADVTRMRQAMIARKSDITKGGQSSSGMKNAL